MRKGCAAALLTALLLLIFPLSAAEETEAVPQLEAIPAQETVLQADLTLQLEAVPEFGEKRLEQAAAMLRHLSLSLQIPRDGSSARRALRILVDEQPVVALQTENDYSGATITLGGGSAFRSSDDSAALLLGEDLSLTWGSLRRELLSMPADAETMVLAAFAAADPAKVSEKEINTALKGFGKATRKQTLTYAAEEAMLFRELLLEACPAGELSRLLSGLSFSGKQELRFLYDAKGNLLKIGYTGRCGADDDHQRKVTADWLLLRADGELRDDFTLTAPAVKGADSTSITFTRTDKQTGTGRSLALTYADKEKLKSVKTGDSAKLALNWDAAGRLTGTLTLKQEEDADSRTLELSPDLTMDAEALTAAGSLGFRMTHGKNVTYAGTLILKARPAAPWTVTAASPAQRITGQEEAAAAAQALRAEVTKTLVRHLVLLPGSDADFLLDGFDEATRTKLINLAEEALRPTH